MGAWAGGRDGIVSGVDIGCFRAVPHCFLLGKCPSYMHMAWWAIHQVGRCHQWSGDQWEHDPNEANQNSLKGIDMGVGREGLSPFEFLQLGKDHETWSRLVPSVMPHAASCLRKKASPEERRPERESWWQCWTSWIQLYLKQPLLLDSQHLSHTFPFCNSSLRLLVFVFSYI